MELAKAYQAVSERLDRIDFPALHRGFSRFPFALYNDAQAYMDGQYFEKPAEFVANTSVLYRGAYTAIWHPSDSMEDMDVLASKLAHEMLHALQRVMNDTRWADERAAFLHYKYDPVNTAAKLEEAACMRACLTKDQPEAFQRLLSLRRARMERFPSEFDYEARIEQIEGTAHYAEHLALRQLAPDKAEKTWARMLDTIADPAEYFPVRFVTYKTGAAFIACLRKYTSFETDRFTDTPFAVEALANASPCALPESGAEIEQAQNALNAWRRQTEETVSRALQKNEIVLEGGAYRLIIWNVFNSYWDGPYAVLTDFIAYFEGDELPATDEALFAAARFLYGDFIAEIDEDMRLRRVWRQ